MQQQRRRFTGRKHHRRSAEDHLDAQILGQTMLSLRVARGLTQQELAALSGIARQSIFNIETGRSLPRWPTLMHIIRALGVSGAELLAATDAAVAERRPAVQEPAPDEALRAAVDLAYSASRSLSRCLALLEVAQRGQG